MNENKVKKGLPAFIGVAAVWMGTHFGPGVASGTQLNVYYVKFGVPGIIMTVLAMCLLGYALYCSMEASRIYKTYEYQSWAENIWGFKWIVILFDISFLITCMTALGGSLNAVATLMLTQWGLNYWVGVGLVIICGALLCAFGADLVRRSSTYMMFVVVGLLLLVIILVVAFGDGDLAGAIANQKVNLDPKNINFLKAAWSAVIYAAFQATVVANIASVADTLGSRKESKKAAVVGIIANIALLVIEGLLLFSFTGVYNITGEALPIYSILQRLGFNWLTVLYIVVVFIAVLSTVVGFAFGGMSRFAKYYRKEGKNNSLRDGIFVAVLLLLCAFASKFGIVALVSKGYTILGYLNLPVIVLPAIILGGRKISKKYLKEHNIPAVGIDD